MHAREQQLSNLSNVPSNVGGDFPNVGRIEIGLSVEFQRMYLRTPTNLRVSSFFSSSEFSLFPFGRFIKSPKPSGGCHDTWEDVGGFGF